MNPSDPGQIEALLAHADWIRGVARGLVGDAARADDLVQESWLAALRRPPQHGENLRGWLGRVIRRQALQTGRSESRRRVREEIAARPEASLEDLAQRASVQRDVVGHVLALEEPFRSVVLLRFFEDRRPPEIAKRLDIPLKTVHSRLARAFEKLRTRLDSEYGSSEAWAVLLLPLAGLPSLPPPAASSVAAPSLTASQPSLTTSLWIMKTQAKLVLWIRSSLH